MNEPEKNQSLRLSALPGNFKTYVCAHVFRAPRPVDHVCLTHEGTLIAACAGEDHDGASDWFPVGFGHIIKRHPELAGVPVLQLGEGYERATRESSWEHFIVESDEEE